MVCVFKMITNKCIVLKCHKCIGVYHGCVLYQMLLLSYLVSHIIFSLTKTSPDKCPFYEIYMIIHLTPVNLLHASLF